MKNTKKENDTFFFYEGNMYRFNPPKLESKLNSNFDILKKIGEEVKKEEYYEKIANKVDKSSATLKTWKTGRNFTDVETCAKLLDALECDILDIADSIDLFEIRTKNRVLRKATQCICSELKREGVGLFYMQWYLHICGFRVSFFDVFLLALGKEENEEIFDTLILLDKEIKEVTPQKIKIVQKKHRESKKYIREKKSIIRFLGVDFFNIYTHITKVKKIEMTLHQYVKCWFFRDMFPYVCLTEIEEILGKTYQAELDNCFPISVEQSNSDFVSTSIMSLENRKVIGIIYDEEVGFFEHFCRVQNIKRVCREYNITLINQYFSILNESSLYDLRHALIDCSNSNAAAVLIYNNKYKNNPVLKERVEKYSSERRIPIAYVEK